MRLSVIFVFMATVLLVGCETTHRAAQEVGKPVGAVTKTVGGVTEGAAEAYGDYEQDNPYNR